MKINRKIFFDEWRRATNAPITQTQVDGLNELLAAIELDRNWKKLAPDVAIKQIAYLLATVKHETAHDFQPKEEKGFGRNRAYGQSVQISASRRVAYFGRGLVQLTWLENYAKASFVCKVDLVNDPDLALAYPHCYTILADGMRRGWFTGRKLADYINAVKCGYREARRIINGTDRAEEIAGYAEAFEKVLRKAVTQ